MLDKLREQIDEQANKNRRTAVPGDQFFVTLVSSCLFSFAARPMLSKALGLSPGKFLDFLEQRRRELPAFLKRSLQP
jgi:hypothetical protein